MDEGQELLLALGEAAVEGGGEIGCVRRRRASQDEPGRVWATIIQAASIAGTTCATGPISRATCKRVYEQ